jgi:anti-sigma factor RsiW
MNQDQSGSRPAIGTGPGADARDDLACIELVELVTEYLEGALDPTQGARVERHLTACDGCTAYLEQMRVTLRIAGSLAPDDIPAPAIDRLLAAFGAIRHERGSGR